MPGLEAITIKNLPKKHLKHLPHDREQFSLLFNIHCVWFFYSWILLSRPNTTQIHTNSSLALHSPNKRATGVPLLIVSSFSMGSTTQTEQQTLLEARVWEDSGLVRGGDFKLKICPSRGIEFTLSSSVIVFSSASSSAYKTITSLHLSSKNALLK